jgi:ATP-dependent helicase HrpB
LSWIDAPPPLALQAAMNLLLLLHAVNETGAITDLGKRMALFPVHPRLSRLLIEAVRFGARSEACRLAARLSEGRLQSVANGAHQSGGTDLDSVLSAKLSHTGQRAADQFRDLTRDIRTEVPIPDPNGLEKAILAAYGDRVARRRGQELLLCGGGSAELEQGTVITSEFVVALEIEDRSDRSIPLVRLAVPIEPDWLLDTFPERIEVREEMIWNRKAERVEQVNSLRYQQLTVDETRSAPNDLRAASVLLAQTAGEVGWAKFLEDEEVRRLLQRVKFLSSHVTEIPGESELVMSALRKLSDGLTSFAELRQAAADGGLLAALHSQLDIRLLNDLAPAHINLPRGRRARIDYSEGQPPSVSSRLQDFSGMTQTPTVAGGSVPLVLKLLAPNHRPVQVTTDLVSFWKNLYPQLRRELNRRYPRHSWPESPE